MQRSFISMSRFLVVFALCPCMAALVGCGDGASGPTGTVSGKVTYKASPVPEGCVVAFVHEETSKAATAQIGADGSYTLKMLGKAEVPTGAYKISVSPPADTAEPGPDDPEAYAALMEGGASAPQAAFPAKYLTSESSGLAFTVEEGPNTFNVEMTD